MATKEYFCKVSWDKYNNNDLIREHDNTKISVDLLAPHYWEVVEEAKRQCGRMYGVNNFTIDFMIEIPQGE